MGQEPSRHMHSDDPEQELHAPNGGLFGFCSGVQQCCDALTEDQFNDNFDGQHKPGRNNRHVIRPINSRNRISH